MIPNTAQTLLTNGDVDKCANITELPSALLNILHWSYSAFECLFGRFPIDTEAPMEVQLVAVGLASLCSLIIALCLISFALVAFTGVVWYLVTRGDKIIEHHVKGIKWTSKKTIEAGKVSGQALQKVPRQAYHIGLFLAAIITSAEFIKSNWIIIGVAIALVIGYVVIYVAPRQRTQFIQEVSEETAEQLLDV